MRWVISHHKAQDTTSGDICDCFNILLLSCDLVRLTPLVFPLLSEFYSEVSKHSRFVLCFVITKCLCATWLWLNTSWPLQDNPLLAVVAIHSCQSLFPELLFANHSIILPPCRHDPPQSEKNRWDKVHRWRERFNRCNEDSHVRLVHTSHRSNSGWLLH